MHPPLPYHVHFAVDLEVVRPRRHLHATISGDISGEARLDLAPATPGTTLHLVADLEPERPFLRGLSWLAQPVTEFGHDQILDRALEQFATNALHESPPAGSPG